MLFIATYYGIGVTAPIGWINTFRDIAMKS